MPSSHRLLAAVLVLLLFAGCAPVVLGAGPAVQTPVLSPGHAMMADGAMLPLAAWLPRAAPRAVVLGVHGFGDYSRNFLDLPAPLLADAGIALYAHDQRGFGAAPNRGYWPGDATLIADVTVLARLLRARHPGLPLYLMGESMGVAVLLAAAVSADPPPVDGYILLSPAVRGRASMPPLMRHIMELMAHTVPAFMFNNAGHGITPTNNWAAARRWATDPLTAKVLRFDQVYGLVGLMDHAVAALPDFVAPALVLYGGRDDLVPASLVRDTLHAMPKAQARIGYYPQGYHMLLRDKERALVAADILAWIADHNAVLPSGAGSAADERETP